MHSLPVRLIINAMTGAVIGALVIGLMGLLLAGPDGIITGVLVGLSFGFVAGLSIPAYIGGAYWWQGVIYRFGLSWQKKQIGEDKDNDH
jgi:hypothetical protein